MNNKRTYLILVVVCVISLAAHLAFYPSLPQQIPLHWGTDGNIDGWGEKWQSLMLDVMPLALLGLMSIVPNIDPRRESYEKFGDIWRGFVAVITLFLIATSWLTELSSFGVVRDGSGVVNTIIFSALGILFIVLGNYMPRVRQNYTFGVKTPWALADEHVWNRSQRMGGIVFIVMGIVMLTVGLLGNILGGRITLVVSAGVFIGGVVWLYVYSYLVWRGKLQ